MGDQAYCLERIDEPMREPVRHYADLLRRLAGGEANALTLFGRVVAGTFDRFRHTARSVFVVGAIDLEMLKKLAEHGANLGRSAIAAPLVMTPDYIRSSCDTFPLELIEIKQKNATVFGEDHFDDLTFENGHVRLECERELKSVLIGMRQGLLAAAGRKKVIEALVVDVGERLLRTLRGMLWLKNDKDAKAAAHVVEAVEKIIDRKLDGVRQAINAKGTHGWDEFGGLYHDVAALGEVVDAW